MAKFVPTGVRQGAGRGADPHPDHPHQLLPELVEPLRAGHDEFGAPLANKLYDPNVEATLEQVARLAGQYDAAAIAIVGHTDGSMKGKVPPQAVRELSRERANAVKQALVDEVQVRPQQVHGRGQGLGQPADPSEPDNHALNRRVEISVYPVEAGG